MPEYFDLNIFTLEVEVNKNPKILLKISLLINYILFMLS